jgi:hypothetical protein
MKVKVIIGPTSGIGLSPPMAAEIESALREWLDDNPNASIEHVAQTPLSSNSKVPGLTTGMLVVIFYHD